MNYPNIITDVENIPSLLKQIPHWVNWRYSEDKGRLTKIPFSPSSFKSGSPKYAKANDSKTWGTYEQACANLDYRTGVGFEIGDSSNGTHSGLCCIDLDHVGDSSSGVFSHKAGEIVGLFGDTYVEYSPSGTGLHIWTLAEPPAEHPKKKNGIEIYSDKRFITMTGKSFGEVYPIRQKQEEVMTLLRDYMEYSPSPTLTPIGAIASSGENSSSSPVVETLKDGEIMYQALAGADGEMFAVLYYRYSVREAVDTLLKFTSCRTEQEAMRVRENILNCFGDDDSKMDFALVKILDKYDRGNKEQTDRLFRDSDLYRDKWGEKRGSLTYGEITMNNAMKENREAGVYNLSPSVVETQEPQGGEKIETLPPVSTYSALSMRESYLEAVSNCPPRIPTGFPYLDLLLDGGLYPSLIVLGAQPGEGKTALGLQMMNNIARRGKDALILSLEMSRFELIERSVSCLSHKLDSENALTIPEITSSGSESSKLKDDKRLNLEKATELFFSEYAPHLFIYETMGDMTTERIRRILDSYVSQTGSSPVVMVDYIQLLQQPENIRHSMSDKQILDKNISSLKQISRDFNTPVLAISSLNRATYSASVASKEEAIAKAKTGSRVRLESFKESGAIEYSADIVLGLNKMGNNKHPRKMELDILKNRHGKRDETQCFDYYADFNRFDDVNRKRGTE